MPTISDWIEIVLQMKIHHTSWGVRVYMSFAETENVL